MNFSNETALKVTFSTSYISLRMLTAIFGSIIFLLNLFILVYLLRLLADRVAKKTIDSLWIHLFSVCINDILCGLTLFFTAVLYVDESISIYACAITIFFSLALLNASQGNILCISVQRYICARNLRSRATSWQTLYTKTLLVVNLIIAVGTVLYFCVQTTTRKSSLEEFDHECRYSNVIENNAFSFGTIFIGVGLPLMIVSDILCILTVIKLKTNVSVGQDAGAGSNTETARAQNQVGRRETNKLREQTAIATIILIIVSFNISYLPSVLSLFVNLFGGYVFDFKRYVSQLLFFSLFINSFFNPIIIAGRTNTIRNLIKRDVRKLRQLCCAQ